MNITFNWLKEQWVRLSLGVAAWLLCLGVVAYFGSITWEYFDIAKAGSYLPGKYITGFANLTTFYTALIMFDFAFGGHTIRNLMNLQKEGCTPEDKKVAVYFFGIIAVCTTYLISIGA